MQNQQQPSGVNSDSAAQQAQAPPQSQQHGGGGGSWQSEKDRKVDRTKLPGAIVALLQELNPDAPPNWLDEAGEIAICLEPLMYESANSFEEYMDVSTVHKRLLQLADEMSLKQEQQPQQAMQQQQASEAGQPQQTANRRQMEYGILCKLIKLLQISDASSTKL